MVRLTDEEIDILLESHTKTMFWAKGDRRKRLRERIELLSTEKESRRKGVNR